MSESKKSEEMCPKLCTVHVDYFCIYEEGHGGSCEFRWGGFRPIIDQRVYLIRNRAVERVTVLAVNKSGRVTVRYDDGLVDTVEPEMVGPILDGKDPKECLRSNILPSRSTRLKGEMNLRELDIWNISFACYMNRVDNRTEARRIADRVVNGFRALQAEDPLAGIVVAKE